MKHLRKLFWMVACAWVWVPCVSAADIERGEVVAKVRCMPCHHLYDDSKHLGPSLKGIYGRAPTISGVPYKRWDAEALDQWMENSRAVKPNTKMAIPPLSRSDREDIIAYFEAGSEASSGR